MNCPNEPTGTTRLSNWLRRLLRYCRASELKPGVGYRVRRTTNGTSLELLGVAGGASNELTQMRYKSMGDDYLVCRTWNGTTEGPDVNIAKPFELRHSIAAETIDSIAIYYTGHSTTDESRTATATIAGTAVVETQKVTPRYKANDLIYVAAVDFTGVTVSSTALAFIDVNADGRAWGY